MPDLKSVVSHSASIVTRKTGNEYVLVPVTNNIADMNSVFTLNESGAIIWEMVDGEKSIGDLVEAVIKEYDIDYKTAEEDVFAFIEKMKEYLIIQE